MAKNMRHYSRTPITQSVKHSRGDRWLLCCSRVRGPACADMYLSILLVVGLDTVEAVRSCALCKTSLPSNNRSIDTRAPVTSNHNCGLEVDGLDLSTKYMQVCSLIIGLTTNETKPRMVYSCFSIWEQHLHVYIV